MNVTNAFNRLVTPQKSIPLDYSLQALSASDLAAMDPESLSLQVLEISFSRSSRESFLHSLSRDNTQLLINAIFDLPRTSNQEGTFSQLPDPDYALFPRAKPVHFLNSSLDSQTQTTHQMGSLCQETWHPK